MFYWWNYSCPPKIPIWQAGSLWVYVTLECERHWVVLWLCSAFPQPNFSFLPFVVNYVVLRWTKKDLSTPYWGSSQWSSGVRWNLLCSSLQPKDFVRILALWVVRSKHAFLLFSKIRPVISVDKLCDHMENFEIIKLLRRKALISKNSLHRNRNI